MDAPTPEFSRERLLTLSRRLGWIVAGLFLFYFTLYLLRDSSLFAPPPLVLAKLRFTPSPPYADEVLREELRKLGPLPDILPGAEGPEFTALTQTLARHPWVRSTAPLRYLGGEAWEAPVEFRKPVLAVEQSGQRLLLSADGLVLSPVDQLRDPPLMVRGLKLPDLKPGDRPSLPELQAILSAAAALRLEWQHWKLRWLELRDDPVEKHLLVQTAGQTVVLWSTLGEPTSAALDQKKTQVLRQHLNVHGSFDKPNGPYLIDVRQPDNPVRRGLR